MLRTVSQIFGCALDAGNGCLGEIEDVQFDDGIWKIRHLVASTGEKWTREDAAEPGEFLVPDRSARALEQAGLGLRLWSAREMTGYRVRPADHRLDAGKVTDFVIDDEEWIVRYVVVRTTADGTPGSYLFNPWWTSAIDPGRRAMNVDLPFAELRSSVPLHPAIALGNDMPWRPLDFHGRPAAYHVRAGRP